MPDFAAISQITQTAGIPLVVDNTIGTGLVRPVDHGADIGETQSLVIHTASTTHQQLTQPEQIASEVTTDYIRLSVGIEDILPDINQALVNAVT